ncbi:hypothetical protein CYMTET_53539 [Cymbomonas tetramitiformis]|uniref:Uncharacterized protein n=1 Tax=Cymbomonas tetramitiformis TaxID=36881 RepID=A0AAE0BGU4_9CHLO|nr:hypothetical protein CYMTET_53539 [Cymbomonas tetramitiformis]
MGNRVRATSKAAEIGVMAAGVATRVAARAAARAAGSAATAAHGPEGQPGAQGFRDRDARRQTRTMEALARSAPVAEKEPGTRPVRPRLDPDLSCGRGGAGLLGRHVRVWWPADETRYAGVVHAWGPGSGLHVVRYDDGEEVSHDLGAEQVEWERRWPEGGGGNSGIRGQAESPLVARTLEARLRSGESASSEELGSLPGNVKDEAERPVEELAHVEDMMMEQGGADGEVVRPVEADCRVEQGDAVEEAERPVEVGPPGSPTRLVDSVGMPLPSPGRERSLFVRRLFQPVEGDWYSHSMTSMPPSRVVGADGEAATFSWLFCPMILDAVGWTAAFPALPRSAEWTRLVRELRQVLQRAGVTWEVVAGFIVDEGVAPFHFDARRQEELINMDVQVGQQVQEYAAGLVTASREAQRLAGRVPGALNSRGYTRPRGSELVGHRVRLYHQNGAQVGMVTEFFPLRNRHGVQFDDNGQVMQVDFSNSRCAVEYLAADDVFVLSRRNGRGNAALGGAIALPSRMALSPPARGASPAQQVGGWSGLGGDGGSPMEACDAPIVEDGDAEGEPGRGGRFPRGAAEALPEAYEAPIAEKGKGRDFTFLSTCASTQQWVRYLPDGHLQVAELGSAVRGRVQRLETVTRSPGRMNRLSGGGTMASRAQRREQLVDPVIPEASWEWLRGLPLEEVFACPFSTARHVPKRAKNAYAEAMRWVLHSLSGDNEDFWRLQGVPSRLLPAPRPEAQRKSIHLDEWSSSGKESEGCWQLAKAIGRLDPGVLDPLQPETLEALAELHPAGDGLPAQVQAAPLVLEEAAVEAECRRLPVASDADAVCVAFWGAPGGRARRLLQRPKWELESRRALSSAEGAQQGDPLGPFFMAAPLQPVLQAALRAHPDMYIIAYLDDIHILGEPGRGAVEPLEGIQVLGVPIGSDAWVADKCVEIATKAGSILPKLARLNDPQVQLLLLRYCAHPRFVHLVRGVQPHLLMRGGLEHDAGIQWCLQEVVGSPYPLGEEAVAISQLPTRWGLVAAMEDVRGGRERALAAEREEHPVPEGLQIPAEAPGWEGFAWYHSPVGAGGLLGGHRAMCVWRASREPQHTARLEERRKEYLYGDVSPHKLVPFAVEAFGGLGVHAKKFLEMCAERRQERLGPELISATWSNPTFKSYWGQKLMVALQGSQAFGLHTRALEDFPQ